MGIDYGKGKTNIDQETGIRYGAVSCNSLAACWADAREDDYGPPTCPRCGNSGDKIRKDAMEEISEKEFLERYKPHSKRYSSFDFTCEQCGIFFDSTDAFPDEPLGWSINLTVRDETPIGEVTDGDGDKVSLIATNLLDNDMLIVKSRYFTFAPFCSSCVPGAGSLDSIEVNEDDEIPEHTKASLLCAEDAELMSWNENPRTYCLDKTWFEDDDCPYPYWEVATGKLVYSPLIEKRRRDVQARVEYLEQLLSSEVKKAETDATMNWLDCLTSAIKKFVEKSLQPTDRPSSRIVFRSSSPEKQA